MKQITPSQSHAAAIAGHKVKYERGKWYVPDAADPTRIEKLPKIRDELKETKKRLDKADPKEPKIR